MINLNLFVQDVPMWYDNPAGPPLEIGLSYNSQASIANHEPFGNKWTFNYGSYLVVDTGGAATLFMPDGRRDVYLWNGSSFVTPPRVHNTLILNGPNSYDLQMPNGMVYEYRIPAGTASLQPMLTKIRDANQLGFAFGYNTNVELVAITDSWSRVTSLAYSNGLVTTVTDPFGRSALFGYDTNANLTSITDMGGYACSFTYDTNVYLTSVSNALGVWKFYTEPADGVPTGTDYPQPGGAMFFNERLTITDPLGAKQEYYWSGVPDQTGNGYAWYVSPRHYTPWQSQFLNNGATSVPKTVYGFFGNDGASQIQRVTRPNGSGYKWTYDPTTRYPTAYSNSFGRVWQYTHNSLGNVTTITDPLTNVIRYTYATNGHDLIAVSNSVGQVRYFYDNRHNVTSIVDEVGATTLVTYNSNGQPVMVVSPTGLTNTWVYGSDARPERLLENGTTILTFTHDAVGRMNSLGDAVGTNRVSFNTLNMVTNFIFADGVAKAYRYATGYPRVLEEENLRDGAKVRLTRDAMLRPTSVQSPDGTVSRYEYDANGNLTRFLPPNGAATSFSYDENDRVIAITKPTGEVVTFQRDAFGSITNSFNARGQATAYAYDHLGRLTNRTHAGGAKDVYRYDAIGNLLSVTDASGTNSFTRDARGLPVSIRYPSGHVVSNVFNALGQIAEVRMPGGVTVFYTYDARARLTNVAWSSESVSFAYDAADRLVAMTNNHGVGKIMARDVMGWVTNLVHSTPTGLLAQISYQYDVRGIATNQTTLSPVLPAYPPFAATSRVAQISTGNRMTKWGDATLAFDADGQVTNKTGPRGLRAGYDDLGRLTNLTASVTNAYLYDGLDRMVRTESSGQTNRLHRDLAGRTMFETDAGGTVTAFNIYAGGMSLARGLPASGYRHAHHDGGGTTLALTDSSGAVATAYAYLPFGEKAAQSGTDAQPFTYMGELGVRREASNLHLTAAGFVDNDTGRLLSPANGSDAYEWSGASTALSGGINPANARRFGYDIMGRLLRVEFTNGVAMDYVYDFAGNRVQETVTLPGFNNFAPTAPATPSIASGAVQVAASPLLGWSASTDSNVGDQIYYYVYLGDTTNRALVWSGTNTSYAPPPLQSLRTYAWQVVARDNHNASSTSSVWTFTTTNPPPLVNFTASPTNSAVPPFYVLFTDTTVSSDDAIATRLWDFGDGSSGSTNHQPLHLYATGGIFTVTLRVVDVNGATGVLTKLAFITLLGGDLDGDGIADGSDNCPTTYNPTQSDIDGDLIGDVCDPDIDGDGVSNLVDNCATFNNPGQGDFDGDGFGDGCTFPSCVTSAFELQNGLNAAGGFAVGNMVFKLQTGTYKITDNQTNAFTLASGNPYAVVLRGGHQSFCSIQTNDPTLTVLDGEGLGRVFSAVFSNASPFASLYLENLTIRNGFSPTNDGGGLFASIRSGKIVLRNCIIENSTAQRGGGARLISESGSVRIENSRVLNNEADSRAGLWITAQTGSVVVVNSLLAGNTADFYGGALSVAMSTGTVRLVNNTVARNSIGTPFGLGAGLYLEMDHTRSRVDLVNNLFWTNKSGYGSAIYLGGNGGTTDVHATRNLYPTNGVSGLFASIQQPITANPYFLNAASNDYRLLPSSPAINAGTNSTPDVPTNDLDGISRPLPGYSSTNLIIDLGAFEFVYDPSADWDFDGLTDSNELVYGTSPIFADTDGDGISDLNEIIAGSQPTNAASFLGLTSVAPATGATGIVIRWQSVTGRNYTIARTTNLTGSISFTNLATNIAGQINSTTYTDAAPAASSLRIYRINTSGSGP